MLNKLNVKLYIIITWIYDIKSYFINTFFLYITKILNSLGLNGNNVARNNLNIKIINKYTYL